MIQSWQSLWYPIWNFNQMQFFFILITLVTFSTVLNDAIFLFVCLFLALLFQSFLLYGWFQHDPWYALGYFCSKHRSKMSLIEKVINSNRISNPFKATGLLCSFVSLNFASIVPWHFFGNKWALLDISIGTCPAVNQLALKATDSSNLWIATPLCE